MQLRTVPAWVAQVALGDLSPGDRERLRGGGRLVGERVELDVAVVAAQLGEAAAERLVAYEQRCRDFFEDWLAERPAGPYVIVRRPLVRSRQKDTKASRSDLGPTLDALCSVSGLGEILNELTGSSPDWDLIARAGTAFEATITRNGKDTTLDLACSFAADWPTELGGVPSRGELRRLIRVECSHAAWRDRRNRRLVSVEVDAEEIWPDPDSDVVEVTGTTI